jgi:hypothetical protein
MVHLGVEVTVREILPDLLLALACLDPIRR